MAEEADGIEQQELELESQQAPDFTPDQQSEPEKFIFGPSEIPEEWKGKSPREISMLWNMAAKQLSERNEEVETLRELARRGGQPAQAQSEPEEEVDLKELMYENPEKAFDIALQKRLKPYIQEYQRTSTETAMLSARQQIRDFDKYEQTIRGILSGSGAPVTPQTIRSAYLMAKGQESIEMEEANARRAATSEKPSPKQREPDRPKLSELELQVARSMGMEPDEFLEFMDENPVEVEVPDGN